MSNSPTKPKEYNPISCDVCTKRHSRCNKELPICSTCKKRNIECSYKKKPVYKRYLHLNIGMSTKVKKAIEFKHHGLVVEGRHVNKTTSAKEGDQTKNSKNNKEEVVKDTNTTTKMLAKLERLPPDLNRHNNFNTFYLKLDSSGYFKNILSLFLFPSPFKRSIELHLSLQITLQLKDLVSKKISLISMKEGATKISDLSNDDGYWTPLLGRAKKLFFEKQNFSSPIFLVEGFEEGKRSELTKIAIWACGLTYIDPNEDSATLLNYLSILLERAFSNPLNIKPTLENLQCILTILIGLSFLPWVRLLYNSFSIFCYQTSYTLGLHLTATGLRKVLRNERALAFSYICGIALHGSMRNGA